MGIGVPVFNERGMFLRSASGGRTHVDTNETLLCACSFLETVKERSRKFVPIFLLQLQITVADFLCWHRHVLQTDELNPWRQNSKVHHRIHNSPPTIPLLSQVNPLQPPPPACLPKIHSNPILPPTPQSFKWSLSFGISHQNPVHVSPLSHACHMPRPPHSPWFDMPNDMWWRGLSASCMPSRSQTSAVRLLPWFYSSPKL
jgi:hypothetical protein